MTKGTDDMIREYLASIGRKGGKARALKYDKATLSKWAKKGGRPPKIKKEDAQ
jgi:general stress protein YciG